VFYPVCLLAAPELVLCVNQGAGSHIFERRRRSSRALNRHLASVTTRIERSHAYRRSLKQLLDLADALKEALGDAQRERWLALEEALLEHNSCLNEEYFLAGVELGRRKGRRRSMAAGTAHGRASQRLTGAEPVRDAELIRTLAELIRALAER
jgi:hypothetical protein